MFISEYKNIEVGLIKIYICDKKNNVFLKRFFKIREMCGKRIEE